MAARNKPQAKKPGGASPKPNAKPKAPTARKAITRQYGLVKNDNGEWVRPDMAFLERQLASQGWGKGQTAVTPVNIGGYRFLTGMGKLTYTGDRSDAAKRNPGAAWAGNGGGAGGVAPVYGDPINGIDPNKEWTKGVSGATGEFITEQGGAGPAGAEAETSTTKRGGKNAKRRKKAKKLTNRAKKPGSPGGKRVTPKERKVIRRTKPNPAKRAPSQRLGGNRKKK